VTTTCSSADVADVAAVCAATVGARSTRLAAIGATAEAIGGRPGRAASGTCEGAGRARALGARRRPRCDALGMERGVRSAAAPASPLARATRRTAIAVHHPLAGIRAGGATRAAFPETMLQWQRARAGPHERPVRLPLRGQRRLDLPRCGAASLLPVYPFRRRRTDRAPTRRAYHRAAAHANRPRARAPGVFGASRGLSAVPRVAAARATAPRR
jgi:hypothetical protein